MQIRTSKAVAVVVVMVTLAPDVAAAFPDAAAVNEALRLLLNTAKKAAPSATRKAARAA